MSSARERLLAANKKSVSVAGQYDKEPTRNDEIAKTPIEESKLIKEPTPEVKVVKEVKSKEEPVQKEKSKAVPASKDQKPKTAPKRTTGYEFKEDTKVKRVNISLPDEVIKYLKFKAARTRNKQYTLATDLLVASVEEVKTKKITFKEPILDKYRIRLNKPMHFAVNLPEEVIEDIQIAASELAMTSTQYYNFVFTEAMNKDRDFEY